MTIDKKCRYHISLVLTRWFKEDLQTDPALYDKQQKEPFVFSDTVKANIDHEDIQVVSNTYMQEIHSLFPPPAHLPPSTGEELTRKRRFGELTGLFKKVAERAAENRDKYEKTLQLLRSELANTVGVEDLHDPTHVKGKGRPKKRRLVSAAEPPKGGSSNKCSKCGIRGHYKNTCKK